MSTHGITEVIAHLAKGGMIILADDEDRENEGDFVMVAQLANEESITFMAEMARTIITLALTPQKCASLNLPLIARDPGNQQDTAFTVTIDAASGITTGSSAAERLTTIKAAVSPDAKPEDLVRPGHVFPLQSVEGGVLSRAGHTEAACDLARLAGFEPAGLISEIQLGNGQMARMPDLEVLAKEHGMPLATISSLIEHRCRTESLIVKQHVETVSTAYGQFHAHYYCDTVQNGRHVALVKGEMGRDEAPLVRVVSYPDFLGTISTASQGGDSPATWTVMRSLEAISKEGSGVLLGLHIDEPRPVGSSRTGQVTVSPDGRTSYNVRNHGIGAQLLRDLGVKSMRLLSSPLRLPSLEGFGLNLVEIIEPE